MRAAVKERIDVLLVKKGLAPSREKARAFIMAGAVFADGQRVDKPGTAVGDKVVLDIRATQDYVSRGGKKLEKAIESFHIALEGCVCADIGASTGGFTDCMLQHGAAKVYAVDVGYGQLAWSLRTDTRVVNLERTNVRYITAQDIPDALDFFTIDVSFISLKLVLPAVVPLLSQAARGICLIKPQFEAGREHVGKNGVVRDRRVHQTVIRDVACYIADNRLHIHGLTWSPIKGPKGNIEYLVYVSAEEPGQPVDAASVVSQAHLQLMEE